MYVGDEAIDEANKRTSERDVSDEAVSRGKLKSVVSCLVGSCCSARSLKSPVLLPLLDESIYHSLSPKGSTAFSFR